jgi:hypothetical protein
MKNNLTVKDSSLSGLSLSKFRKQLTIMLTVILFSHNSFSQHWEYEGNPGPEGLACVYVDTIADLLYLSGGITHIANLPAKGIASWNGIAWDTLGRGIDNYPFTGSTPGGPTSMCRYHNKLYIAGGFRQVGFVNANYMAYWDSSVWYAMPTYPKGVCSNMMVHNDELYVCGTFDSVGNIKANGIAKWDGINWSTVNNLPNYDSTWGGGANNIVCMAFFQGNLYVAGDFGTSIPGYSRIVYWDGTVWHGLANGGIIGGMDGVNDMTVYNNELYVGGTFTQADGNAGNYIMKWDGVSWSDVGGGIMGIAGSGQVFKMIVWHNKLYVVGQFIYAGGIPAVNIATWDGTNWCALGGNFDNPPINIEAIYHDTLYIGGAFNTIDSDTIFHFAKWIGGNYTAACTTVGINEIANEDEVSVLPNPCGGELRITNYELGIKEVRVYNMLGSLIRNYESGIRNKEATIDISSYAKGMYFVEIKTERGVVRKKIIKE